MKPSLNIRFACPDDLDFIYDSLVELFTEAHVIERFSQSKASLSQVLFSIQPSAEVLIGEIKQTPAGFALFSMTNRSIPTYRDGLLLCKTSSMLSTFSKSDARSALSFSTGISASGVFLGVASIWGWLSPGLSIL